MNVLHVSILDALQFAAQKHEGQRRKDPEYVPYISHPAAVGLILAKAGYDDAVVCAGILHDTIEDTPTTQQELEERFGAEVASLVIDVTEDKSISNWVERKRKYREHLKQAPTNALAISAADLLANKTSCLLMFKSGINAWKLFAGNSKAHICELDWKRFEIIKARLDSPIVAELEQVLKETETYEDF